MLYRDNLSMVARSGGPMERLTVHKVPMLDTGLGREAGYENDAALIEAGRARRAELERLLTPEALARFDAAEAEAEHRFLFGDGSAA